MSFPIARPKARGFTLIELLIVVIILAILAAIAIPQFSASTVDARNAALDANLATVRSAIEQYRVQHNNVNPGVATAAGGTCSTGATAGTGLANTAAALISQLSMMTNAAGQACSVGDPVTYRFGPYLRGGIPNEPISNKGSLAADIAVTTDNATIVPTAVTAGWAYNTVTAQFIANSNATDGNGRTYFQH